MPKTEAKLLYFSSLCLNRVCSASPCRYLVSGRALSCAEPCEHVSRFSS